MFIIERAKAIRKVLKTKFQTKALIFLIVAGVQAIDSINVTSFITSVEQIQAHYNCSYALASWSLSAYTVTFSSFIAFFGRASDIIGHSEVFNAGLFFLGIFSIVAAAVDSIYVMIVFRALQGIAAAATIPATYAIVVHTYNGKSLTVAIGCLTGSLSISQAAGMIIGGAFSASSIGYKGILWLVAGYSLMSFVLGCIFLDPTEEGEDVGKMKQLDFPGITLFISGAILLVTGFTEAGSSWKSPAAYVPIIAGVLLILLFLLLETLFFNETRGKSIDLMIPKKMWSVTNFKVIPIVTFFVNGCYFLIFLLSSEFYQDASRKAAVLSGVMTGVPLCCIQLLIAIFLSLKLVQLRLKTWCVGGLLVGLVGVVLLNRMHIGQYWRYGLPGIILFSGGTFTYFYNYMNLIILATPLEMQGLISGICLTMGQFGASVFIAGVSSVLGNTVQESSTQVAMANKISTAFYLPLAGYVACILLVLVFVKNLKPENHQVGEPSQKMKSSDEDIKGESTNNKAAVCGDITA